MQHPRSNQTSRPRTLLRRMISVPLLVVASVLVVALSPALVLVAALVDVVFRRWGFGTVRIVGFAIWYLLLGVVVQIWGLGTWILTLFGTQSQTQRGLRWNYRLIDFWITQARVGLRLTVGLRIEVDHPELAAGQVVIAARHQSLADVYIPTGLAVDLKSRVRVVLTSGLLNEPSLDLIGNRTSQYWIQRGSSNMSSEVAALGKLGEAATDSTALVIFPEGGLYRPERTASVIASLEKRDPVQADRGRLLNNLLPARAAGFSAMLDGVPDADVVIVGHVGMEQLTDGMTIWRSVPLKRPALVTVRRYPRESVPVDLDERKAWLNDRWEELDAWITTNQGRQEAKGSS